MTAVQQDLPHESGIAVTAADPASPQSTPAQPASLLGLPDFLLLAILEQLTAAADLGSAAASCTALRALCGATCWLRVLGFDARRWTPGLPGCLRWTAAHCPQMRRVDLSGAAASSDGDLLPLSQLSALTGLSLAGLWRFKARKAGAMRCGGLSGGSSGAGRHRGSAGAAAAASGGPALHVLARIVGANRGLLSLDLGGTGVPVGAGLADALAPLLQDAPNATKAAHGLQHLRLAGCPRAPGGDEDGLRQVLLQCPALTSLDLSGCRWATAQALPQDDDARSVALTMLPLRQASFAGCEMLGGIGWLLSSWRSLEGLDLSGTAADDADVNQIAARCARLRSLDLGGCVRIRGQALQDLGSAPALQGGWLRELRLADLAWASPQDWAALLAACGSAGNLASVLDLSGSGGLDDAALISLAAPQPAPRRCCLRELRLGGASRLSAAALQQLGAVGATNERGGPCPLLGGLHTLDLSHVQCLGGKGGGDRARGAATAALAAMVRASGCSLRWLSLDGCWMGGGLLPRLVDCCPAVQALSLVGCGGVGDSDLAALAGLRRLTDLSVGGASLAWHEHRALTGRRLTGLTRLRIARRPFLTDAQLAPILAANRRSLARLELAGCAALTDASLLHLLPPRHAPDPEGQPGTGRPGAADGSGSDAATQPRQGGAPPAAPLQGSAAPPLQHLQLVCCERFTGGTARQLARLRSLRLGGCPAVCEVALQGVAVCCTQLTLLELPAHLLRTCVPVAPGGAASHLVGLQVVGGREERGGGRLGRRRP